LPSAGYETWAELFRRDTGLLHQKGWHPTDYGAVGAAAACASLRRLDPKRLPGDRWAPRKAPA
jgi:2-methylcitrate dehydratase PrpD